MKSARTLSGNSRQAFAMASGISAATLRAWEEPSSERRGLTTKGATRLVNALNKIGVYCTEEWLLTGLGPGPKIILPTTENSRDDPISWGEEESILLDIESFKANNPSPIVAIVTDASMLPKFSYGDYVAGNKTYGENIKKLIGTNCIVEMQDKTLIRRLGSFSEHGYTLTALNQDPAIFDLIIINAKIQSAAEIVWHRWRKKIQDIIV